MRQNHCIAVAAFPAAEAHHAVARRQNFGALRCGIVDTGVHAHGFQHRVDADAVGRGNAGVMFDGLAGKAFLQRVAGFVIKVAARVAVFVVIRIIRCALRAHFGGQHIARGDFLAAEIQAFV